MLLLELEPPEVETLEDEPAAVVAAGVEVVLALPLEEEPLEPEPAAVVAAGVVVVLAVPLDDELLEPLVEP